MIQGDQAYPRLLTSCIAIHQYPCQRARGRRHPAAWPICRFVRVRARWTLPWMTHGPGPRGVFPWDRPPACRLPDQRPTGGRLDAGAGLCLVAGGDSKRAGTAVEGIIDHTPADRGQAQERGSQTRCLARALARSGAGGARAVGRAAAGRTVAPARGAAPGGGPGALLGAPVCAGARHAAQRHAPDQRRGAAHAGAERGRLECLLPPL